MLLIPLQVKMNKPSEFVPFKNTSIPTVPFFFFFSPFVAAVTLKPSSQ